MRSRSILMVGALLLTGSLAACASGADGGGVAEPGAAPAQTSESAAPTNSADAAALAQAQAWLDAAVLPPGAVRSQAPIDGFGSYTGWPCGPVEELEGFWTIPGATVADTANWLRENPTANLLSTAGGPVPDDGTIDSAIVGYIPERDSQEGIVYTVAKTGDGVAVRAEVAALTESASCPTLPDGGTYGAPGQG